MSCSNRATLARWMAQDPPPLQGLGSTTPTTRLPRPTPLLPDSTPAELARDAMATMVADLGGQATASAGAVHFVVGTMRVDFVMGLTASQELLERDLRAVEAMAKAALAALGVRS